MSSPFPFERVSPAVELLLAMTARLGWPKGKQAPILDALERAGVVESWPDAGRFGATMVTLSAGSIKAIGLRLAPSGDRWRLSRHD